MKNLVILSYGREIEYRRAVVSVLSFRAWYKGDGAEVRTVIFTDKPDFFEPYLNELVVEYVLLTPELLTEMLGEYDYIHRRKIAVIDQVFQNHPSDDIIFIDSDTFFTADCTEWVANLEAGKSYMHTREWSFEEGITRWRSFGKGEYPESFVNLIESKPFMVGNEPTQFNRFHYSWNSGVLGITKEVARWMPDIFRMNDEFYQESGWFISEQLAFGLVLQTKTQVTGSEAYVCHYWGQRQKLLLDYLIFSACFNTDVFQKYDIDCKSSILRKLTGRWKKMVEADKIQERSTIALSNRQFLFGLRTATMAMLHSPLDVQFLQEVMLQTKVALTKK